MALGQPVDNARGHATFSGFDRSPTLFDDQDLRTSARLLDTLFSFPAPGTFPTGLAWEEVLFWHADYSQQRIYKLSPTGDVIGFFDLPSEVGSPAGIEWDGASLWVVNEQLGRVFILDTNGTLLRSFGLPDSASGDPQSWGLAWDGQYMWHSQYEFEARIFKLDPVSGEVLFSFVPPTHLILDIAWADGFLFGVDLSSRLLYKMDPATGTVVDSEPWQVPYPLGLLWDGSHFWNVSGPPSLGTRRIYQASSSIVTSAGSDQRDQPVAFTLAQNHPNPFNPTTVIRFTLAVTSSVTLNVFNLLGQEVARLVNEVKQPGMYEVTWDASGFSSGVYFYRLASNGYVAMRKMVVLR